MSNNMDIYTKRKKVVKLELAGNPVDKMHKVASTLYNIQIPQAIESDNSSYWRAIDTLLFSSAKESYEQILRAFDEKPRVFKLESCKEKVWAFNADLNSNSIKEIDSEIPVSVCDTDNINIPEIEQIDTELETFINPFKLVNFDHSSVLSSGLTLEIEVWAEKLNILQKLTPREDLTGYEYRESLNERRSRIIKQRNYDRMLEEEIRRRQNYPTSIEEIEDALFDIVDTVCKQEERLQRVLRRKERRQIQKVWHPATVSCRLRPLQSLPQELGINKPIVTDMEMQCDIVTMSGLSLPRVRPWHLLIRHELERELEDTMFKQKQEIERLAHKSFSKKISNALTMLQLDPKAAMRKIVQQLQESLGIQQRQTNTNTGTVNDAEFDFIRALKSDNVLEDQRGVKVNVTVTLEDYIQRRFAKVKHENRIVNNPDVARIKMLFIGELPAPYVMRPRRTWRDDWADTKDSVISAAQIANDHLRRNLEKLNAIPPGGHVSNDSLVFTEVQADKKITLKKKDEPLIDLKRLIAKKDFNALIKPEELIYLPPKKDVFDREEMVMDQSERKRFEQQLLTDVATAGSIPVHHLHIEEIRRFPVDSPELVNLKKTRDSLLATHQQEIEKIEKKRKEDGWFKSLLDNAVKIKDVFPTSAESSEMRLGGVEPAQPRKTKEKLQYSTFIISNSSDVSKDPTHWLTANMMGLTPEKRREYRIQKLRHVMKSYELTDRQKMVKDHLDSLRRLKSEVVEDAVENVINPFIREVFNPTVAFVTPYVEYVAKEAAHYAAVIAADPRVVEAVRVIKLYLEFIKQHTVDRITGALLYQHNQFIAEVVKQLRITAKAIADVQSLQVNAADFADIQAVMDFICQAVESNVATEEQVRSVLLHICEAVVSRFDESESAGRKGMDDGPESRDEPQEDFLQAIRELKSSHVDSSQGNDHISQFESVTNNEQENEVDVIVGQALLGDVNKNHDQDIEMKSDNSNKDLDEGGDQGEADEEESHDDEDEDEEDGDDDGEDEDEDEDHQSEQEENEEEEREANNEEEDEDDGDGSEGTLKAGNASSFSAVANKLRSAVAELEILDGEEKQVLADLTAEYEDSDNEIMDLISEMICAVELNAHDTNCLRNPTWTMGDQYLGEVHPNIMSELLQGDLDQRVFGFEVSIDVVITKSIREALDIGNLAAEDIAVLLEQQLFSFGSSLHSGQVTKNCVAISHTLPYKRRAFDEWEHFWINSLHPAFFGYSALDTKPKKSTTTAAKSISSDQVLVLQAKEIGLQFSNPTDKFSTRNKETFDSLKHELPEGEDEDRDGKAAALRRKQRRMNRGANGEEEFDVHHRALKMYRPNLATVTEKDIERLGRLYRAFKNNYELEMQSGLIDGMGMKPEQYTALKNRDTAFRLYRTAKSRYHHMHRAEMEEYRPPDFHPTRIDLETFDGWIEEVRREDQERLWVVRTEKEKMKTIMKQEAHIRRKFLQSRSWIIQKFIECCGEDAILVGTALGEQLAKLEETKANLSTSTGFKEVLESAYFVDLKKATIAEAKKTRKLFDLIRGWLLESAKLNSPLKASLSSKKVSMKQRKLLKSINRSEKEDARSILLEILKGEDDSSVVTGDPMESSASVDSSTSLNIGIREDESVNSADINYGQSNKTHDGDTTPALKNLSSKTATSEKCQSKDTSKRVSFDSGSPKVDLIEKSEKFQPILETNLPIPSNVEVTRSPREALPNANEFESGMHKIVGHPYVGRSTGTTNEIDSSRTPQIEVAGPMPMETNKAESMDDYFEGDDEEDDTAAPAIQKLDTFRFLDMCLALIRAKLRKEQHKKRAEEKKAKADLKERRLKSMEKHKKHSTHAHNAIQSSESDEGSDVDEESHVENILLPNQNSLEQKWSPMTDANVDLVASLKWVECMMQNKQFIVCLRELPTMDPDKFSRDELAQFASILVEVGPLVAQIVGSITLKREEEKRKLLHHGHSSNQHPSKKKRAHHSHPDMPAKHLDEDQHRLATVQQLHQEKERLLDVKKKAEKEKALARAHTHLYIQFKKKSKMQSLLLRLNRKSNLTHGDDEVAAEDEDDPEPFCYVCRENLHKFWIRQNESDEFKWKKGEEERISSHIEDVADNIREATQLQMKQKLTAEAEELLRLEDVANSSLSFSRSVDSRDSTSKGEKKVRETAHDKAWKKELAAAKELLARAGLPAFDPTGLSTLPREPPRKDEVLINKPVLTLDESASTETCGLKIRVWHRDATGLRSNFLGVLQLMEKDVLNAAKGLRTFKLCSDPYVIETNPTPVEGTVTLRLCVTKTKKQKGFDLVWKLNLIKFDKVSAVDSKLLSNVYCEVYWKGPAFKYGLLTHTIRWVSLGTSLLKPNTTSASLTKDQDNSTFELPPVWTDYSIPEGREYNLKDKTEGGGWVPANSPLVAATTSEANSDDESEQAAGANKGHNNNEAQALVNSMKQKMAEAMQPKVQTAEEARKFRLTVKLADLMVKETQKRLDVVRLVLRCEERERQCMNHEEVVQRDTHMKQQQQKYRSLIRDQDDISRRFTRLQLALASPPPVLTRVRFMMGEELQGGGLRVHCQDPVDGSLLHVITLPILHKQDEDAIAVSMNKLLGKSSSNLVKIRDFYLFQAKEFTSQGFSSIEERAAIIVSEFYTGPSLMRFVREHWETLSNDQFRDLLCQVATALAQLHEDGIVHRNVSPDCITVTDVPILNKNKNFVSVKHVCRLGDYFLMHNPRGVGCNLSKGRADWGCKLTSPPEAADELARIPVSAKSDVYALGVCAFYWATRGVNLPERTTGWSEDYLDRIRALIPLRWEKWLHALLAMCLQPKPEGRSTAKEIQVYLSSRFGKK